MPAWAIRKFKLDEALADGRCDLVGFLQIPFSVNIRGGKLGVSQIHLCGLAAVQLMDLGAAGVL